MGYSTDFYGKFKISPVMEDKHRIYLNRFCATRRMRRDSTVFNIKSDPLRIAVGLPANPDYFVGIEEEETEFAGQGRDSSVLDYNSAPAQLSLWCQWHITGDGEYLKWDGGEKFYSYIEWLQYIIDHFLKFWGYQLNGVITWHGESVSDTGTIFCYENIIGINEKPKLDTIENHILKLSD